MVRRITARELAGGEVNPSVRPSDELALRNIHRGMESEQRYYDKEFPKEQLEDHVLPGKKTRRAKFRKGGMVGRDYCK